jgi:hypothetical protein
MDGRFRTRISPAGIEARGYVNHFVPGENVTSLAVGRISPPRAHDDGKRTKLPY